MAYSTEKFLKTIDDEIKEFRENYASFPGSGLQRLL